MTPNSALTAVIARLTASGLTQVRSPLGTDRASSQRISRSFAVKPASIRQATSPSRGRPDVAGLRVTQDFDIELCHQIKPNDGQEAPSQALTDLHTVWKHMSVIGSTLCGEGAISIGGATQSYEGGGAFMVTRFSLSVTYNLSLVI